jgi:hypothetical protein
MLLFRMLTKFSLPTKISITAHSRIHGAYLPGLWLQETVRVRGTGPDSICQQRSIDFLMYPVFGIRGEWLFGALLFLRFWNKRLGMLGAIGSTVTFVTQSRSSPSC